MRALRLARHADIAPVQDQPVVRILAELFRRRLEQAVLDFAHCPARREPGAVRHAEDVRVDCDRRLAEGDVHHDVRGLAANAGQCLERRALARHFAAVFREDHSRRSDDVPRLHTPQADRADVAGKAGLAECRNRGGRRRGAEEWPGREVDALVRRLGGKDDRHEQLVGRHVDELAARARVRGAQALE